MWVMQPAQTVWRLLCVVAAWTLAFALAVPLVFAQQQPDDKLPNPMAVTTFWRGSVGYSQLIAIRTAFREQRGVDLRAIAAKNASAQLKPLRSNKAHFALAGIGASYLAQEGAFMFATRRWGPQPVRLILANMGRAGMALAATDKSGIKTLEGLRGRRLPWIKGAAGINQSVGALLAFAGLDWTDVRRIQFSSHAAAWTGLLNGKVDAAWGQTITGKAYRLAAARAGLVWLPVPHHERTGWRRLREKAPYFQPYVVTEGAGLSPKKPLATASYPYPALVAYADLSPLTVAAMMKAVLALHPHYANSAPGLDGWLLKHQMLRWVIPVHAGAIRYLKSEGRWGVAQQQRNDRLIRRQHVLRDAWQELKSRRIVDNAAFVRTWRQMRSRRLEAAGFRPVYH